MKYDKPGRPKLPDEIREKLDSLNENRTEKRFQVRRIACPLCGSHMIRKIDTGVQADNVGYRYRYECEQKHKWSTKSTLLLKVETIVIKRDGRKDPFSEEKYVNSLRAACKKRPISEDRFARLGKELSLTIEERATSSIYEIKATDIAKWALNTLKSLDLPSYLRYKSVSNRFQNLTDFKLEIHKLEQ